MIRNQKFHAYMFKNILTHSIHKHYADKLFVHVWSKKMRLKASSIVLNFFSVNEYFVSDFYIGF